MAQIKLMISDFDGTLVDTFEANYLAYQKAFAEYGLSLTYMDYKELFGLRYDDFINAMRIKDEDVKTGIKKLKCEYYPLFFEKLIINRPLLGMLRSFKNSGGFTALASTARKENLMNALSHIGATDIFELIISGEDVKHGKPNPEIYKKALEYYNILPDEALVFEDSKVGIEAANNAGVNYVIINKYFFNI